MTKRSKSHALCVAASLALLTLAPASSFAAVSGQRATASEQQQGTPAPAGRARPRARPAAAAAAAPTAEQNLADAQTFLTSRNSDCQVTEANFRGQTATGDKLYEAVCANDFGYMLLVSETQPMAINCLELSESQRRALAANPEAQLGPKCELPVNDNYLAVLTNYAASAQLPCNVSEGTAIGKRGEVNVYEIGCAGTDGYRINRNGAGWDISSCLEITSQPNGACRFTTKDEQIATVATWFSGSDAASCNITNIRYIGANPNGSFYEAACNGTDGIIARLDNAKAVQQVYPCAEAAQIGGGCRLTDGAPQGDNAPTT